MNLKQRIRGDARRVAGDAEAAALLACLVEHLFDPDLDAHFLARACGATRESRARLAAVVGPLKRYATELRMIEAAELVRDTKLTIAEIGERLGYRVVKTFRRAFVKSHQIRPNEMRRRARAERAEANRAEATGDGAPDPVAAAASALEEAAAGERRTPRARAVGRRRRAVVGLLDARGAGELRCELRRRYPALEKAAAAAREDAPGPEAAPREELPMVLMAAGQRRERMAAGAVFDRILALPDDSPLGRGRRAPSGGLGTDVPGLGFDRTRLLGRLTCPVEAGLRRTRVTNSGGRRHRVTK